MPRLLRKSAASPTISQLMVDHRYLETNLYHEKLMLHSHYSESNDTIDTCNDEENGEDGKSIKELKYDIYEKHSNNRCSCSGSCHGSNHSNNSILTSLPPTSPCQSHLSKESTIPENLILKNHDSWIDFEMKLICRNKFGRFIARANRQAKDLIHGVKRHRQLKNPQISDPNSLEDGEFYKN